MPIPFQIGLFLTALVLAAVRFERSLREVLRAGGQRRAPGENAAARLDGEPGRKLKGDLSGEPGTKPNSRQPPGAFNWRRWYHLAVLWGIVLLCVPFLLAVAFPGRIIGASRAADRWLTGGVRPPTIVVDAPGVWDVPPLTERERAELERSFEGRTSRAREELARSSEETERAARAGVAGLVAAAAVLVALGTAAALARRSRRPWLMTALGGAAFLGSAVAFVFAGPISSRLAAVERARRVIEAYSAARAVRTEDARFLAGPVKIVGRPTGMNPAEAGYLYLRRPRERGRSGRGGYRAHEADVILASSCAGFRMGDIIVPPAGPAELRVVLPHVRLGQGGREVFIREDEDVLVVGYMLSASIAPWPGRPVIVAPASPESFGGRGVFRTVAADLLGAERRYVRRLVPLQLLFGALAAWFGGVFCSAACEHVLAGMERRRARRDAPVSGGAGSL